MEPHAGEVVGQSGVEVQPVASGLEAGEPSLQQVDGAGHGSQVDALGGHAACAVGDVGVERLAEEPPGGRAVDAGQHPGVHDLGQGGPVGGAWPVWTCCPTGGASCCTTATR
jgi:hypothetical protein